MPKSFIKKNFLLLSLILFCSLTFSQSYKSDIELILQKNNTAFRRLKPRPHFMFVPQHGFLKYNPVSLTFGGLLYCYQRFLSVQVHSDCSFSPSCSEYSRKLIQRYGLFKGIICTADRLMRCNRIALNDADPLSINKKTLKITESVERYKLQGR